MIDTVILRIHDIQKNSYLIRLLDHFNNNGFSTSIGKVPSKDLADIRKKGIVEESEILDILHQKRTGNFIIKTRHAKQMNASNHYSFSYYVDYTKDHIEMNFSIPKYKYGTNILMFGEHVLDRDFAYYQAASIEENIKRSYKWLMGFLKSFFKREFFPATIDLQDVEINRIDVCFNQVFKSKEEAIQYLNYQKSLKKKYARDEDGVMRDYATSLMYTTKRYSAKIYHKGAEYEKNDLKEHLKINGEKGKEYFKTKKFKEFADKILRYELTIRNGLLNYLHKHHIFRKDCRFFQQDYKTYLLVENVKQRNIRISKAAGKLKGKEKEQYLRAHCYERVGTESKKIHQYVNKILTRRRYFMLEADIESIGFNLETVNYNSDTVRFSGKLLTLCLEKLMDFVKEFQVKELPEEERVKQLIETYNRGRKSQLPKTEMLHFYSILLNYGSFKEAEKFTHFSRATVFRYKERFRKIGITDATIKPVEDSCRIPNAPLDLMQYHTKLIYDHDLLRGINVL